MAQNTNPLVLTASNASLTSSTNNRIIVTDPNEIIAQQFGTYGQNAIPDYETMSPFVEMYAIRKEGVEIVLGDDGTYQLKNKNAASRINFLNFDIDSQSYTTNYTGDIMGTPDRESNEGFGISDISVKMNANYMPMVDVKFIDIKGSSLIRPGDKSPLAVLFDFPSPIFKIRLKGAFGKFVEYDLHMTKNDIEYTDGGDFVIKASFIGEFFGPLTDVLLGYIKSVPYLKGQESAIDNEDRTLYRLESGETTTINSFAELIGRGELLYTKIADYQANTNKTKLLIDKQKVLSDAIPLMRNQIRYLDDFDKLKLLAYAKKQNPPQTDGLDTVKPGQYQQILHTLALRVPVTFDPINPTFIGNPLANLISGYINDELLNDTRKAVESFKKNINDTQLNFANLVTVDDIRDEPGYYTYYIDYTKLVAQVDLLENVVATQFAEVGKAIQEDTKKIVSNSIDFRPSIRNVFEILLNDFDSFLTILKKAGETEKPLGDPQYLVKLVKPLVQAPYPEVVVKKITNNSAGIGSAIESDVLVYPGTFSEFREWEEVKLVESYCKSLVSQLKVAQQLENLKATSSSSNYIPLFPLDSYLDPSNDSNYYRNITSPSELFQRILLDYVVLRDYAYGIILDANDDVDYTPTARQRLSVLSGQHFILKPASRRLLIDVLARSQARNIANGLAGTNRMSEMLLAITGQKISEMRLKLDKTTLGDMVPFYFDVNKVYKNLDIQRKNLADHVLHRTDPNFNGIKEVMDPLNTDVKQLIEEKIARNDSDFEKERDEMISSIASTIYGELSESKPVVTKANTLLFNDIAAKNSSNKEKPTDFLSGGTGYTVITQSVLIASKSSENTSGYLIAPLTAKKFIEENFDLKQATNLLFGINPTTAKKFLYPGAVEVPYWYAMYIGYLIRVDINDVFGGDMSKADREIFGRVWDDFALNYDTKIIASIKNENYKILGQTDDNIKNTIVNQSWFNDYLTSKRYIINNSSTTFLDPANVTAKGFRSVQLSENDATLSLYLNTLFDELQKKLKEYAKKSEAEIIETESRIRDPDFKLNIYMSFKTIYDRWLAGNNDYIGEAGQKATNPLRERFKFISRSQQDIGDLSIIDFRNLLEDSKNPEINVYSAISRLLGNNQYMFFPLHSFMDYNVGKTIDNWENNFKILDKYSETNLSKPSFVCMFMGSYSSRLNIGDGDGNYSTDGFSIMDTANLPSDFASDQGGRVFAFNVKVGSQSQMVFSSFTANTTEFKNTDVSLKVQDEIIKKQTETNRIGKAQNLLNIYTQRSYTMGVTIPFGNMCIQPTQYFEISGIPIWNGIYMIHEVSHSIAAGTNRLITQFKGYKLCKYVFPLVTDYLLNYMGISTEFSSDIMGIGSAIDVSSLNRDTITKINALEPRFVPVFREFLASVAASGWTVDLREGRRTVEKQIEYNKINPKNPYPGGKYDSHIQGMAIDCNFTKGNITLGSTKLNSTKEQWEASGIPQKAISLGLRWGGNFDNNVDLVHFDAGYPDGQKLGPRTAPVISLSSNSQKYNSSSDTGLLLSSLLPFGDNSPRFIEEVRTLGLRLMVNPNALMAVMYLESEFKTKARSRTSSAAGLIQFIDSTAMDYTDFYNTQIRPQAKLPKKGLTSNFVATLDEFDQLKLVGEFLRRNLKGSGSRKSSFFDVSFSVFSPNGQQKPDDFHLYPKGSAGYIQNREFDRDNKGFITIIDYKNFVLARVTRELGIIPQTFLTLTA